MHSQRSFKLAMTNLIALAVAFICIFIDNDFLVIVAGLLIIFIGIVSSLDVISSIRGFREKHTTKKWVGFMIKLLIVLLFISIIVANIFDLQKTLI